LTIHSTRIVRTVANAPTGEERERDGLCFVARRQPGERRHRPKADTTGRRSSRGQRIGPRRHLRRRRLRRRRGRGPRLNRLCRRLGTGGSPRLTRPVQHARTRAHAQAHATKREHGAQRFGPPQCQWPRQRCQEPVHSKYMAARGFPTCAVAMASIAAYHSPTVATEASIQRPDIVSWEGGKERRKE